MTVTARFHRAIGPDLEAWIEAQPGADPDRRRLAKQTLEACRRHLIDTRGKPNGYVVAPVRPLTHLWEFEPGWWFVIAIRTERRWLIKMKLKMTITQCVSGNKPPTDFYKRSM